MDNDKNTRLLSAWICIILLELDIPVVTYPLPFNRWGSANHYNLYRTTSKPSDAIASIPIHYKLDVWSRYDNPEEGKALEGDIRNRPFFRKTTTTDESLVWPNGVVPYFVADSIANEPEKLAVLDEAMNNIMELTCVRFVRIYADNSGKFPSGNWVNITGHEQGCSSDLGRSIYGPSNINLDLNRCFRVKGHALHEILHTLGVFHEHTRPDRDDYIQILWDNIKEGNSFNFQIMDENAVTNYDLPYDYDSIMHYSMTAFSKNRSLPTILPRKKNAIIGQRDHLSFYDVQKLLNTYKCKAVAHKDFNAKIKRVAGDRRELSNSNKTERSPVASIGRALNRLRASTKKLGGSDSIESRRQAIVPRIFEDYFDYEDYAYYYDTDYLSDDLFGDTYYYYE